MKKYLRLVLSFVIVFALSGISARVNAGTKTTFTVGDFIYTVSSDKTVRLTSIAGDITDEQITIPETVTYEKKTYTVTSIEYDSKYQLFDSVKSIVVPKSVTEQFFIINSLTNESEYASHDEPDIVPFPSLTDITFLSETAPKKISVMTYLDGFALTYHVPSGSEAAYEKIVEPNRQFLTDWYDAIDGDHSLKSIDVKPVVVSESQPNKESELFSTDYGIYYVIKSVADGKGEVTLLKAKKMVPVKEYETEGNMIYTRPYWGEYTIESQVSYHDYKYMVTKLGKNSLAGQQNAVLSIPNTITQMDSFSIDATHLKAVIFSENCKVVPENVFITGENDAELALIYIPNTVTTLKEKALSRVWTSCLVVPKNSKHASKEYSKCKQVIETTSLSSDVLSQGLSVAKQIVDTTISKDRSLGVKNSNANSTEKILYVSLDNGTAKVSQTGVVTPKHKGTGYVVAVTSLTGQHSMLKVNVADQIFSNGIYTYRVNYDTKPTVTIIGCNPKSSTTKLVVPSTVTYNKQKYSVTQILAGDSIIDEDRVWEYTGAKGYPRTYDYSVPMINAKAAKKSNIKEIVIPSSVKLQVGDFGNLPKLKIVRFQGNTAPSVICMTKTAVKKVVIYIPKKALTAYKKTTWRVNINSNSWQYYNGWEKKSNYVLKTY